MNQRFYFPWRISYHLLNLNAVRTVISKGYTYSQSNPNECLDIILGAIYQIIHLLFLIQQLNQCLNVSFNHFIVVPNIGAIIIILLLQKVKDR